MVNGNFRILKWRYVSTIYKAIFSRDIPLHRPYKFLKWPLNHMKPWAFQIFLHDPIGDTQLFFAKL